MSETLPADELPAAIPDPARQVARDRPGKPGNRDAKGRFLPKNRFAYVGGKTSSRRLVPQGLIKALEAKAPKEWAQARERGREAARHRMQELTRLHGDLSSGVCWLLLEAGEQRGDARYLRAKATSYDDEFGEKVSSLDLLRLALQLSNGARQSERDAWELACREAEAHKRAAQPQPTDLSALLTAGEQAGPDLSDRPGGDGDSSVTVPGGANSAESLEVPTDCESSGRGDCHENSTPVPPSTPPGGLIGRGAPPSNEPPEKPDDD